MNGETRTDGSLNRRTFLLGALASAPLLGCASRMVAAPLQEEEDQPLFEISLAQWSLHRTIRAGMLDPLDFPRTARENFGLRAIEYVNTFFKDKARDESYLCDLRTRTADQGVRSLLIMCDGEGALGAAEENDRTRAIENHHKWVEAAKFLGCHSIRVNAQSSGSYEEQQKLAADGLRRLTEFAAPFEINVIVENHGGLSSNGTWLAGVMKLVNHPRCGTLPDFGNFCLDWSKRDDPTMWYDRYRGVAELMPFAKAVSAKSNEFNAEGDEVHTDYRRMMKIVLDAGYRGFVGIEYEGERHTEAEGIRLTKALLERVRSELAAVPAS